MTDWYGRWHSWIIFSGTLGAFTLGVIIFHAVFFRLLKRLIPDAGKFVLVRALRRPTLVTLLVFMLLIVLPASPLQGGAREAVERGLDLTLIGCTAWIVISMIQSVEGILSLRYRIDVVDNLLARRIQTRVQVFHHIAIALVVLITLAIGLMTFPNVRSLGASLLASAGLVGIIAGMAARPALSNLMAGLQIAFTEPIRLEDVVVVEGEWGNIEEIYATYVVVRIWDLRRMILPLTYFIEHPFQNWTRTSADVLGTVFLYTDYRVPVDAIRQELHAILKTTPLWKGLVWGLQVTDATEKTVQLRALMDATDSSKAWDLRCYVREKLIAFMQMKYPESLPQTRFLPLIQGNAGGDDGPHLVEGNHADGQGQVNDNRPRD